MIKPLQFSSPSRMEYAAVLYFLRNGVKLHFYSLGTIFEENMKGVQRGAAPWLWVSNRGEQHPCWHTTLPRKVVCVIPLLPADAWKGAGFAICNLDR